eukprot:800809_1
MFVVSSEIFTTTMYFPLWHHQTANNQARQSSLSSTAINQARQLIEGLSKYNAIINDNETHNEIHISNIEEILNQFDIAIYPNVLCFDGMLGIAQNIAIKQAFMNYIKSMTIISLRSVNLWTKSIVFAIILMMMGTDYPLKSKMYYTNVIQMNLNSPR